MSQWTSIAGVVYLDTMLTIPNIKEFVEKFLEYAPKITGSERNANIFVNVVNHNNFFDDAPCYSCVYGNTVKRLGDNSFICKSYKDYKCPELQCQTKIVITVIGELRDKNIEDTKKEWKEFLKYLKTIHPYSSIDIKSVKIE